MTAPNSSLFNSNSFVAVAGLEQTALAFPAAIYLCAGDGRVHHSNQKAAELWGRTPTVEDPQERFCGRFRLYRTDGAPLPHDWCAMAVALQTGRSFRDQEVVIEEPGCRLPSYSVARGSLSNASVLLPRQKRPSDLARSGGC